MFKNEEGFSLLELVVAVGVAGIIAAVALPTFAGIQGAARTTSATYAASAAEAEAQANALLSDTGTTTSSASSSSTPAAPAFSIVWNSQDTLNDSMTINGATGTYRDEFNNYSIPGWNILGIKFNTPNHPEDGGYLWRDPNDTAVGNLYQSYNSSSFVYTTNHILLGYNASGELVGMWALLDGKPEEGGQPIYNSNWASYLQ